MGDTMTPNEIRALMKSANNGDASALARFAEYMQRVKGAFDLLDALPAKERKAVVKKAALRAQQASSKTRAKGR